MRTIKRDISSVPAVMVPGLLIFFVASVADLLFHMAPFGWGEFLEDYLGPEGLPVHMGIMAGMILTLLGLVAWGATRQREKDTRRCAKVQRLAHDRKGYR